uniref:OTU domain-containing protein n=1 Tax=Brassica oleracea TaxID=3712 RepID=A0A3P6AHY6_BRAOL|nr:unnamed protein product [Brassica oleracea]
MKSDGHCLFRALSHQMYRHQRGHLSYRKEIVHHIKKHQELFEPFVISCNADQVTETFEQYCKRMKKEPSSWGGEPELVAASRILHRTIRVYNDQTMVYQDYEPTPPPALKDTIYLSFHGNHYNSLIKLSEEEEENVQHSGGWYDYENMSIPKDLKDRNGRRVRVEPEDLHDTIAAELGRYGERLNIDIVVGYNDVHVPQGIRNHFRVVCAHDYPKPPDTPPGDQAAVIQMRRMMRRFIGRRPPPQDITVLTGDGGFIRSIEMLERAGHRATVIFDKYKRNLGLLRFKKTREWRYLLVEGYFSRRLAEKKRREKEKKRVRGEEKKGEGEAKRLLLYVWVIVVAAVTK